MPTKTNHKLKITTRNAKETRAECSCGGWGFLDGGRVPIGKVRGIHELHKMGALTGEPELKSWRIPVPQYRCDNCGCTDAPEIPMDQLPHLTQRIDVGGIVPAGECGKCGALTYLIPAERFDAYGNEIPDRKLEPCTRCGLMCLPGDPVKVTDRSRDKFLAELLEIAQEARKLHMMIECLDLGPKYRKQIMKRSAKICEWLLAIGDRVPTGNRDTAALVDACKRLVRTIEATGGVEEDDGAPVADPEWLDLGDAYLHAKKALKRTKNTGTQLALLFETDIMRGIAHDIKTDRDIDGSFAVDVLTDLVRQARKILS